MIARIVLSVAALAIVAAAPVGPSATELTALRTAKGEKCPPMRNLSCAVLGDPSELKCSYQQRFTRAKWTTTTTLVGKNGTGWEWLDGGPRCSSLPQH
nr:hypothetical protein [Polymorphobacter sp.]